MLCHGGSNLFIYKAREYVRNSVGTRLDTLAWLIHKLGGSGIGGGCRGGCDDGMELMVMVG